MEIRRRLWGSNRKVPKFQTPFKKADNEGPSQETSAVAEDDRDKLVTKVVSGLDERIDNSHNGDPKPCHNVDFATSLDDDGNGEEEASEVPNWTVPVTEDEDISHSVPVPDENLIPTTGISSKKTLGLNRGALGGKLNKTSFPIQRVLEEKPQLVKKTENAGIEESQPALETEEKPRDSSKYYSAMFAKPSSKKHKTWEGDGFIVVSETSVVLKSTNGATIGRSDKLQLTQEMLEDAKSFRVGGKEVQIQEELPNSPFNESGKPVKVEVETSEIVQSYLAKKSSCASLSKPFVSPLSEEAIANIVKPQKDLSKPMFDPNDEGALVMANVSGGEEMAVVVDPHISRHLREHQREGVSFLYQCVMGKSFNGCILADEMGLGKTLQCISLIWTLLKQSPYERKGVAKRVLIVTPSSLVLSWDKEFKYWLGTERIKPEIVTSEHPIKMCTPQCPVIIISYDMATRSEVDLKRFRFDLMICDEAHKIKNKNGQAYTLLSKLSCRRRVLLTGTPVQNDLMELFALVDFANPGALGSEFTFRKEFEKPIAKYQESGASLVDKEIGKSRAFQLNDVLKDFFLRRSHSVMIKYLPPRITYVVMCKPTSLQTALYKKILSSNVLQSLVTETGNNCQTPLSVILALKKICNHPNLVHPKRVTADTSDVDSVYFDLKDQFPQNHRHDLNGIADSGKMIVLFKLLQSMKGEKVVLVSHYTQTLDVLADVCRSCDFDFKRLDGGTQTKQRQQIIDQFNSQQTECVFLLSSKAGGLGLNLQAASRIILYDIDWNPAHDIQSMARCWRPGQKQVTRIFRLLTSGTIEERIFHRQIMKQDLSCSVTDLLLSNSSVKFTPQDLKDIFSFHEGDTCLTHDLIGCGCRSSQTCTSLDSAEEPEKGISSTQDMDFEDDFEFQQPPKKKPRNEGASASTMSELYQWDHHGPPFEDSDLEPGLLAAANQLQFVFCNHFQ